jgi:hypothetical protein
MTKKYLRRAQKLCDDPHHHTEPTSESMADGYSYWTGVVLLNQWHQPAPGASLQPVVSDRVTGTEESDDEIVAAPALTTWSPS